MGLPYTQRNDFDVVHGGWSGDAESDCSWWCVDLDEKDDGEWKMVEQGNKLIKNVDPYYTHISMLAFLLYQHLQIQLKMNQVNQKSKYQFAIKAIIN